MIRILFAAMAAVLLVGCAHEKTTDFQRKDFNARKALTSDYTSWNELSDTDVLGAAAANPSDEEIQKALDRAAKVDLKKGDSILVLQSGRAVPDARMVSELNKYFRATPFSGVRSDWLVGKSSEKSPDYARALRLAAAHAGAEKIVVFWGSLEVARHDLSTKTITWLPVVDVIVPDQKDRLRVHLKTAVVDVRSGSWMVRRTEPVEDQAITTGWGREHLESPQVKRLQQRSYALAVDALAGQ